jgi:hypothetical protein
MGGGAVAICICIVVFIVGYVIVCSLKVFLKGLK